MAFFRISFPLQMALGILLGICAGLFFGEAASVLSPWASAYIMILKVTAIPYLVVAIIHGIGLLNRAQAMQILKKGSLFIGLALLINIGVIYLIKWAIPAATSIQPAAYVTREIVSLNFAEILIPENIFSALSNNVIPAVVVFCLLIGIALMQLADKQVIMTGLQTLLDVLTKVTGWISRITPFGTFLIMANQAGTIHFATIKQVSTYIFLFILGTSFVVFWIAPRLTSTLTEIKFIHWIKVMIPALILGYTTSLVIVTLPYIINLIQTELQKLYPKDENVQSQVQGTVSVIFNLPVGAIFISAFVFFVAVFFSHKLTLNGQLQLFISNFLTSIGAVGLGSVINSLTFILDTLGLPIDAINIYLTVVPFTAGFQTMVSVMFVATLALLITLAGRGLILWKWGKIATSAALTFLPVLLVFAGLKWINLLPSVKNQQKSIYELEIQSDAKVRVYKAGETLPENQASPDESTLKRILRTKTLQVGYDSAAAPFCFYNRNHKLVGFDVATAYQLAYDLGCERLNFIPLNQARIGEQLNEGLYDIGMSAISISEERLKRMCFSVPYLESKIVFVTRDHNRTRFSSIEKISWDTNIKVAALVNSAYESIATQMFPEHEIVLLDSYDDFERGGKPVADLLIWEEPEAIAWTAIHLQYHVVYPRPGLGRETLGYPIRLNDPEFLCYLNSWLALKESDGFKNQQYSLWILGKTQQATPPERRWSVMHNIIGIGSKPNR